jgi:hypothetical protein
VGGPAGTEATARPRPWPRRYAVRGDADNLQLKAGVTAAFGLVRAAAAADMLQSVAPGMELQPLSVQVAGTSALYAAQSMMMFGFAAVAVEAAFQRGLLSRFGAR